MKNVALCLGYSCCKFEMKFYILDLGGLRNLILINTLWKRKSIFVISPHVRNTQ